MFLGFFRILQLILFFGLVILAIVFLLPKMLKKLYSAMKTHPSGKEKIAMPVKEETPATVVKPSVKVKAQPLAISNRLIKPALILVLLIIIVVIGFAGWQKLGRKVQRAIGCEFLTPKVLEELENAGGFRPLVGEICNLSEKNYFLRIVYRDYQSAYGAALTLAAGSKGSHRKLEGVNLVQDDKSSAFFFANAEMLGVLVINEKKSDSDLINSLKRLIDEDWQRGTDSLQVNFNRTVEDDIAGQMLKEGTKKAEPTVEPRPQWEITQGAKEYPKEEATPTPTSQVLETDEEEQILSAAKSYVYANFHPDLPEYSFKVSLTKRVGDYALVAANPIPPGSFEPAGVVLQKVSGEWVGQDMGTIFPEWEEKVPELFNF